MLETKNRLEMIWIDAMSNVADVMKFMPIRNYALGPFVEDAMSLSGSTITNAHRRISV